MSMEHHIADAENTFFVLNVGPDFCKVGKKVVPFDISQTLDPEKNAYSVKTFNRSEPILLVGSIIESVLGNAGKGVNSKVSLSKGDCKVIEGAATVIIENRMTRDGDLVYMNMKFDQKAPPSSETTLNKESATKKEPEKKKRTGPLTQEEKNIVKKDHEQAKKLLEAGRDSADRADLQDKADFKRAFGNDGQSSMKMLSDATSVAQRMLGDMTIDNYQRGTNKDGVYAYIIEGDKERNIYLNDSYWEQPSSGANSRAGTILHEVSHWNGRSDYGIYGLTPSRELAVKSPDSALFHADSFAFWLTTMTPRPPTKK
jgi:hypothetical protein